MRLFVDYAEKERIVKIIGSEACSDWVQFCRLIRDNVANSIIDGLTASISWRAFLAYRKDIAQFSYYHCCDIELSTAVKNILQKQAYQSYDVAIKQDAMDEVELSSRLTAAGFLRSLTENQLKNVSSIANLPAAATFSVPGAGKTTEALAYFIANAAEDDRLLVVAPKNAFGAWDEQLKECTGLSGSAGFVRLRGGKEGISAALKNNPRLMIITYSQLPYIDDLIEKLLSTSSCFMFLDESHRIKGGHGKAWAEAVLRISFLPVRKLLLSGTPMPQAPKDLVSQFKFLYPDHLVDEKNVISAIQPVFVRTTQKELGIPDVDRKIILIDMGIAQSAVYETLRKETAREIAELSRASKSLLRSIGHCSIRLLQFVSNPALLAMNMKYAFSPQIGHLLLDGDGPKIEYACLRARELASQGKKVIIWSSFVQNVELISDRLQDIGANYIHGGVDAGSDEEEDSREGIIKRFHNDPSRMVLVANPAACSEGISLHKVCQNAIYVDRSFNAAQYLQSEDRIHRLGLRPEEKPVVEILQCKGTIDEVVNSRLIKKVEAMADALNDKSLSVTADLYDLDNDSDENITKEDAAAILEYFGLGNSL